MSKINRRNFIKAGGAVAAGVSALGYGKFVAAATKKVVVVGGGIGGGTAAKYIRMMDPSIEVTLIEGNKDYYTCFMSNEVLSGERTLDSIHFDYTGLKKHGVKVVFDWATGIDAAKKVVMTKSGNKYGYDKCIVSPGVDFNYDSVDGYSASAAESIPHAWKAGSQTAILRKQLEGMKDGGTFVMAAPPNPFRCPPGPYERVSQIAHYFKEHKPKSQIIILDPKPKFSKYGLFTSGWARHYGYDPANPTANGMIKFVNSAAGGTPASVDVGSKTVTTAGAGSFKADVLNIIPAQKAGKIAFDAGLVDGKGWCPVNKETFESTVAPDVYVIGDSSVASKMPKSGYAANSQGKVCASAVVAAFGGKATPTASYVNTCYSIIAPGDGISVAAVYRYDSASGTITPVKGAGGLTPTEFDAEMRAREVEYAYSWFTNITHDVFG